MQTPLSLCSCLLPWLIGCILFIAYIFYMQHMLVGVLYNILLNRELLNVSVFLQQGKKKYKTYPTFVSMFPFLPVFFTKSIDFPQENVMVK